MKYDHGQIIDMRAEDFAQIEFLKIKLTTKVEIEIYQSKKKDRVFHGYIVGLFLAGNSPYLPMEIRFIDDSISLEIDKFIDKNLSTRISIFNVELIELI